MSEDISMRVRLKPYNQKRGHLTRRHMVYGMRFDESAGWYEVSKAIADKLRGMTRDDDKDLPELFDVCTIEEARVMERAEKVAAQQRMEVDSPARLEHAARSTADLGQSNPRAKSAMPIVADGADPEDDLDDEGGLTAVGKIEPDDETPDVPGTVTTSDLKPEKAAKPASRSRK